MSLAGALILSGILVSAALDGHNAMMAKVKEQVSAVDGIREWKRQYAQLIPVEEKWNKSLGLFSEAKDLLTIHGLVSAEGPPSDPDTMLVEKIVRVTEQGRDLGAQKVCVTSGGGGWTVTDKSFPGLISGMQKLIGRVDMDIGSITLSQEKGKAKAVLSSACLMLRDGPPPAGKPDTSNGQSNEGANT